MATATRSGHGSGDGSSPWKVVRKLIDSLNFQTVKMVFTAMDKVGGRLKLGNTANYFLQWTTEKGAFEIVDAAGEAIFNICPIFECTEKLELGERCKEHQVIYFTSPRLPVPMTLPEVPPSACAMEARNCKFQKLAQRLVIRLGLEDKNRVEQRFKELKVTPYNDDLMTAYIRNDTPNVRIYDKKQRESCALCFRFPECLQMGTQLCVNTRYCPEHCPNPSSAPAVIPKPGALRNLGMTAFQCIAEHLIQSEIFHPTSFHHWHLCLRAIHEAGLNGQTFDFKPISIRLAINEEGRLVAYLGDGDRAENVCMYPACLRKRNAEVVGDCWNWESYKQSCLCDVHEKMQYAVERVPDLRRESAKFPPS